MINKKCVLGKIPEVLNEKDAVHVAIVSVRAACAIEPGTRVGLNEFNEAVPNAKGQGLADPWLKKTIQTGQNFIMVLNQEEVPNVQHVWEHPKVNFGIPTREVKRNSSLLQSAEELGVTYEQLMDACEKVADSYSAVPYPGTKNEDEIEDIYYSDIWYEWGNEVNYEFENVGTSCCPEYNYPEQLFTF